MALLSRKVDYALLILSYLHHRPEGGCARVIADRFGLKKAFAANVLKLLCQRGLVRSQRGIRGGYVLARPAVEIQLAELLDLMGEPFHLADCNRASPEACGPGEAVCAFEAVCPVRERHRRDRSAHPRGAADGEPGRRVSRYRPGSARPRRRGLHPVRSGGGVARIDAAATTLFPTGARSGDVTSHADHPHLHGQQRHDASRSSRAGGDAAVVQRGVRQRRQSAARLRTQGRGGRRSRHASRSPT